MAMLDLRHFLLPCLLFGLASGLRGETGVEKAARLIKAGNIPEAQALLDRTVQADPRNVEAWYLLGQLHWAARESRQAVDCADRAIQIEPSRADFHVLRGNAQGNLAGKANMFKALGLASDALKSLEKAVQLEPGNRSAVSSLFNYYVKVPAIAGGSLDKARALAERNLVLDPSHGHYLKGLLLQRAKHPGEAQAEYRLALAADPKSALACKALGYVELEMGQLDYALGHFRQLVALDPDHADSYDSLGDGLVAKGRRDEAIDAYRKALTLDPAFVASLQSLGRALEQAGRREEAILHYRQGVQMGAQRGLPMVEAEARKRLQALGVKD
jgi:protein O-GlcNAc transferase